MRLLITNIVEQKDKAPQFNKSALIRVPYSFRTRCFYSWGNFGRKYKSNG